MSNRHLSRRFAPICVAVASIFLVSACRTTSDGSETQNAPSGGTNPTQAETKSISGQDANDFIDALMVSGVQDTMGAVGGLTLKSESISCSAAVVPHPVPSCTIDFDGSSLLVPTDSAKDLFRILKANGATVVSNPPLIGSTNLKAITIACSQPVVPNPQGDCSFTIGAASGNNGGGNNGGNGGSGNPSGVAKTVKGTDAKDLVKALQASGVTDTTGAIGALTLKVKSISKKAQAKKLDTAKAKGTPLL